MGSIAGLRSEALGLRAKEDTFLQISQHLGGVNKSLGNQLSGIVDQLQGVIAERTKAYNGSMVKVAQSLNGRDAVGAKSMNLAFSLVGLTLDAIGGHNPNFADVIKQIADIVGLRANINSLVYDYEKGVSQLGYSNIVNSSSNPFSSSSLPDDETSHYDAGVLGLFHQKTALMPGYLKVNVRPWSGTVPKPGEPGYEAYLATKGYIGELGKR